jgi:hypothetical protein
MKLGHSNEFEDITIELTHKNESNALNITRASSGSSAFSSTPAQALSSGTISMWWPSSDSAMSVGLEIVIGMLRTSDDHGGVEGKKYRVAIK